MVETYGSVVPRTGLVSSVREKAGAKPARELPLEVAILLDVFARIEARRQARLRDEQQGEVN